LYENGGQPKEFMALPGMDHSDLDSINFIDDVWPRGLGYTYGLNAQ